MSGLRKFLDIAIPRFITEEVALIDRGDGYEIVCAVKDAEPGESFDARVTVSSLQVLGFGLFPRVIGDVRPW